MRNYISAFLILLALTVPVFSGEVSTPGKTAPTPTPTPCTTCATAVDDPGAVGTFDAITVFTIRLLLTLATP